MSNIKLMYVTNNPQVASIAQEVGVDRIFVDMEYIGKNVEKEFSINKTIHMEMLNIEKSTGFL